MGDDFRTNRTGTTTIDVPVLRAPFPARVNVHAAGLQEHLLRWLARSGLATPGTVRQFRHARFDLLVAALYPTAGPAELHTLAELVAWMFVYDDHFDVHRLGRSPEAAARAADQVSAVLAGAPSAGPLLDALSEFRDLRLPAVPAPLRSRLIRHLGDYTASLVHELELRASGLVPSPGAYLDLRVNTFAWPVLADLVEFADGLLLPAALRGSEEFVALVSTAGYLMILIQDLSSVNRELSNGESHNLVFSLQHERQCGPSEAAAEAERIFAEQLRVFEARRERLLAAYGRSAPDGSARRDAATYVAGLEYLVSGQIEWSGRTERYRTHGYHESLGGAEDLLTDAGHPAAHPTP